MLIKMSDDAEGKEVLENMVKKFRDKMEEDDSLKKKLEDFNRDIQVDFENGEHYNLTLEEGNISDLREGTIEDAEITLATEVETLEKLMNDELGAMEAYAKNKVTLDASFSDLLKFKKLL